MYKLTHKDFACLLSILDAIEKIEAYTGRFKDADEFYENQQVFDATLMNFIVIGEMADKLSDDFKLKTQENVDWLKIKSFRNIIAHNYFGVDAEEVWQIVHDYLPGLKSHVKGFTA